MSRETSPEIATIAARLMAEHDDPEVRRVAASALAQAEGKDEDLRSAIRYLLRREPDSEWARLNYPSLYRELVGEARDLWLADQAEMDRVMGVDDPGARAREALRFYAGEMADGGKRARQALGDET